MADVIGNEHGITSAQLKALSEETEPLIVQLNEERQAGKIPYRDLPSRKETNKDNIEKIVAKLKGDCEILVVLGMGGSALGIIALRTALKSYLCNLAVECEKPRLLVFDNVDSPQFFYLLQWLKDKGRLSRTIFNVISKSGETTETLSQFMTIRKLLLDSLDWDGYRNRVVVTTERKENNGLLKIAKAENLERLEIPAGVPGRFSVFSAVGLFSAAMCGIDIDLLLQGACDMDKRVSCEDFYKNPAAINAAINWYFYNQGKKISVMMPYSYQLKDLADWYRQLWAESLGKTKYVAGNEVHIGPTPVKALGATDQHSQIQLYREGPNDKLFTFLQVNHFEKDLKIGPAPDCAPELGFLAGKDLSTLLNNEKRATEYALLQSKRPCLTIVFPEVNAYTVGQFIYLYEVTTSFGGALFGVNPYDQPAVELGKEATFALMGKPGDEYEKLAAEIRTLTEFDDEFLI